MPLWMIIAFIIVAGLCGFASAKLRSANKKSYAKSVLTPLILYAIVFLAVWIFDMAVPPYILLLCALTVLINGFFGHYLGLYTSSKSFDRCLHAFGSFSFALLTYCVTDSLAGAGGSRVFRALFVFMAGVAMGAVFELFEMMHDKKNKGEPKSQKGLKDTDMDIFFDVIGSALAAVFAYCFLLS